MGAGKAAATPEPNSPYPVMPASVRTAEYNQGRRPPSTTNVSTSVIFIPTMPFRERCMSRRVAVADNEPGTVTAHIVHFQISDALWQSTVIANVVAVNGPWS